MDIAAAVAGYMSKIAGGEAGKMKILLLDSETVCARVTPTANVDCD